MTFSLILHGVPNGQDMWGVNDDTHYFSTFYAPKDEADYLLIEARKVSGKPYCYYTYLKYRNVVASDGRAGGYLGITLRFDCYYRDVANAYRLCEIVLNNLADVVFVKDGNSIKFKVAKFAEVDQQLSELNKKAFTLMQNSATAKDFIPINDSFFKNDGKLVKASLLDCTLDNVMPSLVQYGKLAISKHHPTNSELKKIKELEDRCNSTLLQKEKELKEVNGQYDALKQEHKNLQADLVRANSDINRLNEAVREHASLKKHAQDLEIELRERSQKIQKLELEIQQRGQIADLVNKIKDPLHTLASYTGGKPAPVPAVEVQDKVIEENSSKPKPEQSSDKTTSFWFAPIWQIVKMVLILLTLCSSTFCIYKLYSIQPPQKKVVKTEKPTSFITTTTEVENSIVAPVDETSKTEATKEEAPKATTTKKTITKTTVSKSVKKPSK